MGKDSTQARWIITVFSSGVGLHFQEFAGGWIGCFQDWETRLQIASRVALQPLELLIAVLKFNGSACMAVFNR